MFPHHILVNIIPGTLVYNYYMCSSVIIGRATASSSYSCRQDTYSMPGTTDSSSSMMRTAPGTATTWCQPGTVSTSNDFRKRCLIVEYTFVRFYPVCCCPPPFTRCSLVASMVSVLLCRMLLTVVPGIIRRESINEERAEPLHYTYWCDGLSRGGFTGVFSW